MIVWNVARATEEMCISRSTLFKLLAEKRLTRIKLGRGTFISPAEARALFGLDNPCTTVGDGASSGANHCG